MRNQKTIGATSMSLNPFCSALRLIAGSSMLAALSAVMPTAAWAIDECTPAPGSGTLGDGVGGVSDPSLNGTAPDSFNCTTTPYAAGITYNSNGDLTVTKTNAGNTVITANGINLTGNGSDNVTWDSSIGIISGTTATAGPLLDITTASGDISITAGLMNANQLGTTHGIRANSTMGGDIAITHTAVANSVATSEAAISAVTAGGNINITRTGTSGNVLGYRRGIVAQTSGAGSINITTGTVSVNATDGIAAIDTLAGTGTTTINLLSGGVVNGGPGLAMRAVSTGGSLVINSTGSIIGRLDFSGVTGGVSLSGFGPQLSGISTFSAAADTIAISASSGGSLAAGGMLILGAGNDSISASGAFSAATGSVIDFGSGADTFAVSAIFSTTDGGGFLGTNATLDFGADNDVLNVTGAFTMNQGLLSFGSGDDALNASNYLKIQEATIDFGVGTDTLNQSGTFYALGRAVINGVENFNNSGIIYLGGQRSVGIDASDSREDDALFITSGVFTGSGDSRIFLDADLGTGASQVDCSTPVASDCVNFTGATTAGSTVVTVQDISFSPTGGAFGSVVTLIEGATAAEHFTLDPESLYFASTPQGDAIRKTLVAYSFQYDPDTKRHLLIGAPTDEVYQMGMLATSAQETWRASTGNWLSRQADLRATPGGLKRSNGAWAKLAAAEAERDIGASYSASGVSLDYDVAHQQRTTNLLFGADMVGGDVAAGTWVAGAMLGFARSDVGFDATPTDAVSTGITGGVYASYVAGSFFVDSLLNVNQMHYTVNAPQMGLETGVPMRFDTRSIGGQVETGWRIAVRGAFFIEPLLGVSYISTKFDDADVPGGGGGFDFGDKFSSLRFGGGARVGLKADLFGLTADYSLLARYWNESEARNVTTVLSAGGSSIDVTDAFDGQFNEVVAGLHLLGAEGTVSGFFNLGGKFGDDYQSIDGSVGVRVRW